MKVFGCYFKYLTINLDCIRDSWIDEFFRKLTLSECKLRGLKLCALYKYYDEPVENLKNFISGQTHLESLMLRTIKPKGVPDYFTASILRNVAKDSLKDLQLVPLFSDSPKHPYHINHSTPGNLEPDVYEELLRFKGLVSLNLGAYDQHDHDQHVTLREKSKIFNYRCCTGSD